MKYLSYLTIIGIITFSCQKKSDNKSSLPNLYPTPKSSPLKLGNSYTYNALTGDSIKISHYVGDSLITGKPIKIEGKLKKIKPKLFSKPKQASVATLRASMLNLNDSAIIRKFTVQKFLPEENKFVVKNMFKDTIPTGKPVSFVGNKRLLRQPQRDVASLPYNQKNALYDLQLFDDDQFAASIRDIKKSNLGGIWLASYNGLCYYDGTSFIKYSNKEGLPHSNLSLILEDSQCNVWAVPSAGGLYKCKNNSVTRFLRKNALMSHRIKAIAEDKRKNIWWASYPGLTQCNGKQVIHHKLGKKTYKTLYVDTQNNIWTSCQNELIKFDGENWLRYKIKGVKSWNIVSITEDHQGVMWFGTAKSGLFKYDGKTFVQFTTTGGILNKYIGTLAADRLNNLWIGTRKGLVKYNGSVFFAFSQRVELLNEHIRKVVVDDKFDFLWLSISGIGLVKYKLNSFIHYQLPKGKMNSIIRQFYEDDQGNFIRISRQSLITYDGKNTYKTLSPVRSLPIYSLAQDKEKNMWVGLKQGICKYEVDKVLFYKLFNIKPSQVRKMLPDSKGNLWLGNYASTSGLMKHDGKNFFVYKKRGIMNRNVAPLLEDKHGYIWLRSNTGLIKYDGKHFTLYTEKEGLSDNYVTSMLEDKWGNLWIGTLRRGLMKFDGSTFTYYTTREGLSHHFITSLVEDKQGRIWVGTVKGLNILTPKIDNAPLKKHVYKIEQYNKIDGPQTPVFINHSVHLKKNNTLWWGTIKNTVTLDLNKFNTPQQVPNVYLTGFLINGKHLANDSLSSPDFDTTARFNNYPMEASMPYNKNHLTFEFAAADLQTPHKVKYSYRLHGLESSWSTPSKQGKADYRNLPFGTFTFQVCAISSGQVWGDILEYTFTIRPPWWSTWWFYSIITCFMIGLILAYLKVRTRNLVKKQLALEVTVQARTQKLTDLNHMLKEREREIILLKDQEKEILSNHIKERENELILVMKMVNEKLNEMNNIREQLATMVDKNDQTALPTIIQNISLLIIYKYYLNVSKPFTLAY